MSEKRDEHKGSAAERGLEEGAGHGHHDGRPEEGRQSGSGQQEKVPQSGEANGPCQEKEQNRKKHGKKHAGRDLAELLKKKNDMLQDMENQLQAARQQLENKEDKILRLAAEFENYKKRTRREWELQQKRANADLLSGILGVLDDFDRAFEAAGAEGDHFQSGMRMIHSQLKDVLAKAGLSEIDAEGQTFDPQYHEAMGEAPSEDVQTGRVLHVVQKGYMLHDQLLRPSRVIVARNPLEDEQDGGDT